MESCGSIEKRYRAPWRQWCELSDIPHPAPIDWKDAELVEMAWKRMSGKPKLILKYIYMTRFPVFVIARKCHVKPWNLEMELARAKRIMQIVLDKYVVSFDTIETNLEPALSRDKSSALSEAYLSEEPAA